ncbi:MAG TPA: hypothetical protein VIV66_23565 [Pyrinomonadaceae bacterium]
MKRKIAVTMLLLAVALVGPAPNAGFASNNEGSVTGAAHGLFSGGASLAGVPLESLDFGTGAFLEADGSAAGVFQAVLSGRQLFGQARQITLDGNVKNGTVSPDGRADFSGLATLQLGQGTPPLTGVPFRVTITANSVSLSIDATSLPDAGLTAGAVAIE